MQPVWPCRNLPIEKGSPPPGNKKSGSSDPDSRFGNGSDQMPSDEGPAGAGFEITLEDLGSSPVFEPYASNHLPRAVFIGMDGLAGVVLGEATRRVRGYTGINPVWMSDTAQDIDVRAHEKPAPDARLRSLTRAMAGIRFALRATADGGGGSRTPVLWQIPPVVYRLRRSFAFAPDSSGRQDRSGTNRRVSISPLPPAIQGRDQPASVRPSPPRGPDRVDVAALSRHYKLLIGSYHCARCLERPPGNLCLRNRLHRPSRNRFAPFLSPFGR